MSEFQEGDVVYLKSGGPAMTVNRIIGERNNVECVWFDNTERKDFIFSQDAISKEKPKPSQKVLPHGINL